MKWLKRVRERREADRRATANSRALLHEMVSSEDELAQRHVDAVQELHRATEQEKKLRATDIQNHYSESLTHAFRGKPA